MFPSTKKFDIFKNQIAPQHKSVQLYLFNYNDDFANIFRTDNFISVDGRSNIILISSAMVPHRPNISFPFRLVSSAVCEIFSGHK